MKLEIKGLKKFFGEKLVLQIPALELDSSLTFLRGPNGSGKSSFLRILSGILTPDNGLVHFSGSKGKQACRAFYEFGFLQFSELKVSEHFSFLRGISSKFREEDLLKHFQLDRLRDESVGALSRGWRARLGLALTFSLKSDLYFFDEPLEALDDDGQALFHEALSLLLSEEKKMVFIASHRTAQFRESHASELLFQEGKAPEVVR